jgi:hypothetical protein
LLEFEIYSKTEKRNIKIRKIKTIKNKRKPKRNRQNLGKKKTLKRSTGTFQKVANYDSCPGNFMFTSESLQKRQLGLGGPKAYRPRKFSLGHEKATKLYWHF